MTITEYAHELTGRLHAEGADGPALREALALAVALWLDIDRLGRLELEWGLFATEIQTVADGLYPAAPAAAIAVDHTELDDEQAYTTAMRRLIDTAAQVLQSASRVPGQPRAWQYAHAALALRTAQGHLP